MPGSGGSPCAACKLLRRKCTKECIFAPYFSPDQPQRFASVHKIFGASNVSKMLQELPLEQRRDAASSIIYEANARIRDPVYGCLGAIIALQHEVVQLRKQLATAQSEILCLKMQTATSQTQYPYQQQQQQQQQHQHQHQHQQISTSDYSHQELSKLAFTSFDTSMPVWTSQ